MVKRSWSHHVQKAFCFLGVAMCIFGLTLPFVLSEESQVSEPEDPEPLERVFSDLNSSTPDKITAPPMASAPSGVPDNHHKVALFSGLDKVTGRNVSFEMASGEKVQFGGLYLVANVCVTRMRNDTPEDEAFVQIWEIQKKGVDPKPVFSGWMLASSPGLNTLEHPIYAIWLLACR